jgi:hypothetical protein
MKRLWVVGLVVGGAALAVPAPSPAEWHATVGVGSRYDRGHGPGYGPGYRDGGPAYRYGYDRGWREGSEEGRNDCRKRRDPRFWREGEFRDGDKGYKGWMGAKRDYVVGFRRGYEAGYRRAFAAFGGGGRGYDDRYRSDDRYRDDDWR